MLALARFLALERLDSDVGWQMKTVATCFLTILVGVLPVSLFAAPPKPKPKGYTATSLQDGRIEIVVSGKSGLPSGSEIVVINLREKLESAAAQECPDGYDLEADRSSSVGVAPNGQGFVARQKGVVRCK